jgi:heme-degrading monooxygenase HmoA
MFARVTTLQLQPGKLDELIRMFQDSIAPAAAAQPGFGGITLLTDPQLGKALAVDLWTTEASLHAGKDSFSHEHLGGISDLLAAPPVREVYEASVQVELTSQGGARQRGI